MGCKECLTWCFADKPDAMEKRPRWLSRMTFILAMVGYCVGLGNFWRFPYLCFKWGGAAFFIPYFICLFFIGLPVTLMEMTLGQKFQRGDVGVFRGIHPRLSGVGLASVLAAFCITAYYNIIIGWSFIYLIMSFIDPLPWSIQNTKVDRKYKECAGQNGTKPLYITTEVFYRDIAKTVNEDCTDLDTKNVVASTSVFGWEVYLATVAVWIIVYFIMWKGVNSSSYVVWVTVPLPVMFIFIMIFNGLALENSDLGVRMYLKGHDAGDNPPDIGEKLKDGKMWAQACGQIFFSLGICMGTMTSYSSYNDKFKPIIGDAFKIALTNSFISFCAGFAVFSVVGYLIGQNSPVANENQSIGLAFVAYPAAIETMPAPNLWSFILAITLFTLGIDSAFSMLEAASTVMQDSPLFRKWPQKVIALFLVVLGAVCSLFFSFNWGFTLFDVVDNYLNVYLMLLVGVLEVMGVGWVYEVNQVASKGRNYKLSIIILTVGFWLNCIATPIGSIFSESSEGWIGMVVFWAWMLIVWAVSFLVSGLAFSEWMSCVAFCGVRKLSRVMTKLSKFKGDASRRGYEPIFEFWWNFSIKYFVPFALCFLLFNSLKNDIDKPYNGYHMTWQVIGFMFPILGLLVFLVSLVLCKEKDEFDPTLDAPYDGNDIVGIGNKSSYESGKVADEPTEGKPVADAESSQIELAKVAPKSDLE